MEFYFDKRLSERVALRASYALSDAEETVASIQNVNDPTPLQFAPTHPLPQDQRHAVNVDCTFRLDRTWSVSGALALHSGWPSTEEEIVMDTNESGEPVQVIRPRAIYGKRLPYYQRLDMRATKKWSTSRGDVRFFAELVNLTNHSNVFGYDYFRSTNGNGDAFLAKDDEQWFTILPSLGISWSATF